VSIRQARAEVVGVERASHLVFGRGGDFLCSLGG